MCIGNIVLTNYVFYAYNYINPCTHSITYVLHMLTVLLHFIIVVPSGVKKEPESPFKTITYSSETSPSEDSMSTPSKKVQNHQRSLGQNMLGGHAPIFITKILQALVHCILQYVFVLL